MSFDQAYLREQESDSQRDSCRLLIIDDNLADAIHCQRLLEGDDSQFTEICLAQNLEDAREEISRDLPDVCLMDYHLHQNTAKHLIADLNRQYERIPFPIVVSTGFGDEKLVAELMKMGVQDYLVKDGLDGSELRRALSHALQTFNLQSQIEAQAIHDGLTGLLNRAIFVDRLKQAFREGQRYNRHFALIYLDLDHFKQINDTYGHPAGDHLLNTIARRISSVIRRTDSAARLGGDEFAILLPEADQTTTEIVGQKLLHGISEPIPWNDIELNVSPSIGISCFPGHATSYEALMREADLALYLCKSKGRAQIAVYSPELEKRRLRTNTLSDALPNALAQNALSLAYQPIFSVETGRCSHVEALVRWHHGDNWVCPTEIIGLVLETSACSQFHEWLFGESLRQLAQWKRQEPELKLSLNVPAKLCRDKRIISILCNEIKQHNLTNDDVILEISENYLTEHENTTQCCLHTLTELGFQLAVDDFGSGHSSIEFVANLGCSYLKIDQKFFLGLNKSPNNYRIIAGIRAMANALDCKVIAVGVENRESFDTAKRLEFDYYQGYWVGRPCFAEHQFSDFLKKFPQRL